MTIKYSAKLREALNAAIDEFTGSAPRATVPVTDATLAMRMALLGGPMTSAAVRHALQAEKGHHVMMAQLSGDHRHVPLALLEQVGRSLVVTLIERAARPSTSSPSAASVQLLSDAALLTARLDRVSDAAYDFGAHECSSREGEATVDRLTRRFDEESRGRPLSSASVVKRLFERFDENVYSLQSLVLATAKTQKTWDLNACHDFYGRYEPIVEAAMDAALILEAHAEDRIFGPQEGDADVA
ncbi:hypothetical protein MARCHEWKA_04520 [Brevundimonas phage vB_BpoS-Marchewka]|uniref:Uncharacterized protein n=1 Tax=Brevundimonas phage vB_BpoS-Marchewka TaxID=2948604 RepID=A0A9E7N5Y8_9CAUD|nr:hypothetical protein MARCHEWKA_04520 [Brevundimonas phage vB_BpoS-Marchewka]UTC29408.1 hypothetical protein BAMBUS_03260 [Brevundimonas phage vB_BpoS-Bambus]